VFALVVAALAAGAFQSVPTVPFGALTTPDLTVACISDPINARRWGCPVGRGMHYVHHVALSPDGRNLYSAAGALPNPPDDHGTIGIFRRDAAGGGLRQLSGRNGCVTHPGIPQGSEGCAIGRSVHAMRFVTVSGDGRFVYGTGVQGISIFRRSKKRGTLSQLPGRKGCINQEGSDGCAQAQAMRMTEDLTFTADGRFAYTASSDSSAVASFRRYPRTGALRPLPGRKACIRQQGDSMAYTPGCATGRGLEKARSVTLSPDERFLYVASIDDSLAIFRRNRRTGDLRQLSGPDGCLDISGRDGCARVRGLYGPHRITFAPSGRFAYLAGKRGAGRGSTVVVFAHDTASGALHQLPGGEGCITTDGLDGCSLGRHVKGAHAALPDAEGRTLYLSADGDGGGLAVFRIDRRTGRLTQLPGPLGCLSDSNFPEDGCAVAAAVGGIHFAVLSPDGRFLYGAGEDARSVAVLSRRDH